MVEPFDITFSGKDQAQHLNQWWLGIRRQRDSSDHKAYIANKRCQNPLPNPEKVLILSIKNCLSLLVFFVFVDLV